MKVDLEAIGAWLKKEFKIHSLILFGSHARGRADAASDVDLLGIRSAAGNKRLSWDFNGSFLDIQIIGNKEARAESFDPELLRVANAKILFARGPHAKSLLRRIKALLKKLKKVPELDKHSRRITLLKDMERLGRGDDASLFRRAVMVAELLDNYIVLNDVEPGASKADNIALMRKKSPEFYAVYVELLKTLKSGDALLLKAVSALIREMK